jgi:DNA-binding response OmpR family regulator
MEVNVLLIDDDKLIHKIVSKSLETQFRLESAFDAVQGRESALNNKPDVILLDVEMPGQNGYECCELLKADPTTQDIPVIFLSAKTSIRERMLGYESGADDYLVKPFDAQELNAKLKIAAKYKSQRDNLETEVQAAQSTAMDVMTGNSELGLVMRFVEMTYGIRKLDTLAKQLLELTSNFGLKCSLLFDFNNQESTFSSSGILSPIEKELLSNCHNNSRFIDFGCRTIINYPKVSLLVKNMPLDDPEKYGRYKDVLPTVLGATDAKIRLMETNEMLTLQGEKTHLAFNNIRHSLHDLIKNMHSHQESASQSINTLSEFMQAKLPGLGLEEDQEEFILDSIEKTFNEVTDELANSKEVQITFVTVLKEMKTLVNELEQVIDATQQDVAFLQGAEVDLTDDEDGYQMDVELF